jgi:carboxyl-terminal processing protease
MSKRFLMTMWCVVAGLAVLVGPGLAQDEPDLPDALQGDEVLEAGEILTDRDEAYDNMELLAQVMLLIKKNYYQKKTFDEVTYAALHGLLKSLDDHSDFLEPEAYEDMQEDTAGKFSGIGVHIGLRDGLLTVIAPIEGTPAYHAGLQAGDRIIKIDGTNSVGFTLRQAVEMLRGPKGEAVSVTVRRMEEDAPIDVEIVRDDIKVPSVKGARILGDGVGYVRLIRFAAPTAASLEEAIEELKAEDMSALILDLRNNPGGLLKSAIEVADVFLEQDKVIVSTRGRAKVAGTSEYAATKPALTDVPMVVLINGGSASASEIVAGALQDHKRAVLVGDTSFGKGSVQSVIRLRPKGESAIRLTTALYYTPNDRQIHKKGIDPDIPVYVTPREWRKTQIRRAHVENPELYDDEDKEDYLEITDKALVRAMDLIQVLRLMGK